MNIQIDSTYFETQLCCALERRTRLLRALPDDMTPDWLDHLREEDRNIASIIDLVVSGQGGET